MNFELARRFAAELRRVFPEAEADSAEDGAEIWLAKDALFDPELDQRLQAAPDFHNCRDK